MPHSTMVGLRKSASGVLLVMQVAGCVNWRVQAATPRELLDTTPPVLVRVTLADAREIVVSQPRISGDTLIGDSPRGAVRLPLADIRLLATRRTNVLGTAGLVFLGLATVVTIIGSTQTYTIGLSWSD